eukprot:gene47113-58890_t
MVSARPPPASRGCRPLWPWDVAAALDRRAVQTHDGEEERGKKRFFIRWSLVMIILMVYMAYSGMRAAFGQGHSDQ